MMLACCICMAPGFFCVILSEVAFFFFFFFKQKTAYEMRIIDWSSDVCSSDLGDQQRIGLVAELLAGDALDMGDAVRDFRLQAFGIDAAIGIIAGAHLRRDGETGGHGQADGGHAVQIGALAAQEILVARSEEHTSELQSLMRISYAVFCLKKKKKIQY